MTSLDLAQTAREVLESPTPNLRLVQVARDTLRNGAPVARVVALDRETMLHANPAFHVVQVVREVLRPISTNSVSITEAADSRDVWSANVGTAGSGPVSLSEQADAVDTWGVELSYVQPQQPEPPWPNPATDVYQMWNPLLGTSDFTIEGQDLASHRDLVTSLTISLFTNRRALRSDKLPNPFSRDRGGWWGDTYLIKSRMPGAPLGSRLWLLSRTSASNLTLLTAKAYVVEAIQWLTTKRVASSFAVDTFWIVNDPSKLGIVITVYQKGKSPLTLTYSYVWQQILVNPPTATNY